MGDVVGLRGGPDPREPDQGVCEVLQGLLERAMAGEIRGIAYVVVEPQKLLGTGWAGAAGTRHSLAAGISVLAQRYTMGLREDETLRSGEGA